MKQRPTSLPVAKGKSQIRVNHELLACTAWHSHSLGQTLHVMSHLAMWENDDDAWGAHVADQEYKTAAASETRS